MSDAELAARALADGLGAQLESVKSNPALPSSANEGAEPIANPVPGEGQHRVVPETLDKTGELLAAQNRAETASDKVAIQNEEHRQQIIRGELNTDFGEEHIQPTPDEGIDL